MVWRGGSGWFLERAELAGAVVAQAVAFGAGEAGRAWWGRLAEARIAEAGREAQRRRRFDAEGGAERAQDAAGTGDFGDEGGEIGVGEDGLELAVADGGGLDHFDQPEAAARQAGAGMAEEQRGGALGAGEAGGARRCRRTHCAVAPALVQGGEAGEGAGEVGVEEGEEAAGGGGGTCVRRDGGADAIGHPGEERQGRGCVGEGVEVNLLKYMSVCVR